MAKANVILGRIRAYQRRIEALTARPGRRADQGRDRDPADAQRYFGLPKEAEAALEAFLAGRSKGPWATWARGEA